MSRPYTITALALAIGCSATHEPCTPAALAAIVIPAGAAWSETWPGPVAPLGPVGFGATAAIASWQISWGARP